MGQHVAQSDDFIYIGDVVGQRRMISSEANQCPAANFSSNTLIYYFSFLKGELTS